MGFGFEVVMSALVRNKIFCLARSEGRYARNAKQISVVSAEFSYGCGDMYFEKNVWKSYHV